MKKYISLILLVFMLVSALASCGPNYKSRTAEFYGNIGEESFWYTGTVTKGTTVYDYTQAIDADSVTTIEDHDDDDEDGYVIFDGKYLHQLDVKKKKYDTLQTDKGVKFLFADRDYADYNSPERTEENVTFDNKLCTCEVFTTVDSEGNEVGENKYYYVDDRLYAVVWLEEGETSTTLVISDYSNTIPEDIYTSLPEDFKAGTFTAEQVIPPDEIE